MPHVVLLGDSIFDNGAYVADGPDVVAQVREQLPAGWRSTLLAVDGDISLDVLTQLAALPQDATHLVLSVGGNDALEHFGVLAAPVSISAQAFLMLEEAASGFERDYRRTVDAALARGLPLVVCTIYNANFADPVQQRCVRMAIAVFDDVIIRVAAERRLTVIDLRSVCTEPGHYANDIEPSVAGGTRIAAAIVAAITSPVHEPQGATLRCAA